MSTVSLSAGKARDLTDSFQHRFRFRFQNDDHATAGKVVGNHGLRPLEDGAMQVAWVISACHERVPFAGQPADLIAHAVETAISCMKVRL